VCGFRRKLAALFELAVEHTAHAEGHFPVPLNVAHLHRSAETELGLKQGHPETLYRVALELLETVPLRIDHRSKADIGYALLVAEHSETVKAQPVQLKKRDSVQESFCAIARNCLDQVHANERGVVSSHDPSSVHQMRVGLRRLRLALDLFAKVIPAFSGLDDELRWIASELGAALWKRFRRLSPPH
jgi:inorganic triphosphatase YgiF